MEAGFRFHQQFSKASQFCQFLNTIRPLEASELFRLRISLAMTAKIANAASLEAPLTRFDERDDGGDVFALSGSLANFFLPLLVRPIAPVTGLGPADHCFAHYYLQSLKVE